LRVEMVSKQNTLNTREMPNTRYPNGYLPKIAYHILHNNADKAQYFIGRQMETYGELDKQELANCLVYIMINNNAVIQNLAEFLAEYAENIAQKA